MWEQCFIHCAEAGNASKHPNHPITTGQPSNTEFFGSKCQQYQLYAVYIKEKIRHSLESMQINIRVYFLDDLSIKYRSGPYILLHSSGLINTFFLTMERIRGHFTYLEYIRLTPNVL